MAHGRPDFFGSPIHMKYGKSRRETSIVNCPVAVETQLIDINACAICQGAVVFTSGLVPQYTDTVYLYIDGLLIEAVTFRGLQVRGQMGGGKPAFSLSAYDPDSLTFAVMLNGQWPFENELLLTYMAGNAAGVFVTTWAWYYSAE